MTSNNMSAAQDFPKVEYCIFDMDGLLSSYTVYLLRKLGRTHTDGCSVLHSVSSTKSILSRPELRVSYDMAYEEIPK
jgi:hypothetical protein